MTRQEHLAWCKRRALDILKTGNISEAAASFMSDMGKHEETQNPLTAPLIMNALMTNNANKMKECIEGFN